MKIRTLFSIASLLFVLSVSGAKQDASVLSGNLSSIYRLSDARTFSISSENPTGAKGRGGMAVTGSASKAARDLGRGWKINPIRFDSDLRVTTQDLGWRSGGHYLPLQDDISSVAYWYQIEPNAPFPPPPDKDRLEVN